MENGYTTTLGPSHSVLNSSQVLELLIINTLGLSILSETLRTAAFLFIDTPGISNRHVKENGLSERRECFAFIQGTGLDLFLKEYHLNYDADALRGGFNYLFHVRR